MHNQSVPKPVVLVVLDGWGIAPASKGNAITRANTPYLDNLKTNYPFVKLQASGEAVGLPPNEDGNTETGHLNLGAGQIVPQDLPRINSSIADGSFFDNEKLNAATDHARSHNSQLHLIGLIGSGAVHASFDHLMALIRLMQNKRFDRFIIHPITDGRDSPPKSSTQFINRLQNKLHEIGMGKLGVIMGRYYAMDRDNRWERTQVAYEALTQSKGEIFPDPIHAIEQSYEKGFTDEFIRPILVADENGKPQGQVRDNDAIVFFNYRIDRPRQLTKAFVYPKFDHVSVSKRAFDPYAIKYFGSHLKNPESTPKPFDRGDLIPNLYFVTMTEYETGLPVQIAFPPVHIPEPLGAVVSKRGLRQLRMAETEKERFVTFYFNGQRDDPYPGEDRIIIPSPPVATYDTIPEMSSRELTQTLIDRLKSNNYDFILINYANPDMVAHTGNLEAGIKAAEITDENVKKLVTRVLELGGAVLITADHGNLEEMIDLETGGVDTEHSTFPVPCYIVSNELKGKTANRDAGVLSDVAPSLLELMNLEKPASMTGRSLL